MVLEALGPDATAREGEWVDGPDGRRDRDVTISYRTASCERSVLVECKDYDPAKTGKVGVDKVDAIDSKRHDVSVDQAMICSNAGFTSVAINKATRRGIGLISVMRDGDERIRFRVVEDMYTRDVRVIGYDFVLRGVATTVIPPRLASLVLYRGVPVLNWVCSRISFLVASNPVVTGRATFSHQFTTPQRFNWDGTEVVASGIDFTFAISGQWFSHTVTYDATNGIYDWIRRRARLGAQPSGAKFMVSGVNPMGGRPEAGPPEWILDNSIVAGELSLAVLLLEIDCDSDVPDLSRHIRSSDLDLRIPSAVIGTLCYSDPDYEDTRARSSRGFPVTPDGTLEISF